MTDVLTIILAVIVGVLLMAAILYIWSRYFEARYERTYMTQDDRGFKRALKGKTVLWHWEENVVRGPTAPNIEFVAIDPASGERKMVKLLHPRTGAINLRPQYCAPRPFDAQTRDSHKIIVEGRVQFSLDRDLLKHVYEIQDFSLALESRIQSAFRSAIGKRGDEDLRSSLSEVERDVIDQLRRQEEEGDQAGERGMAIGVRFHTANFTYTQPDEFASPIAGALSPNVTPEQREALKAAARAAGVLALRPQQIDQLADVFKGRDAASTAAILALLDMQTRQNIAEALAASGQLMVITPHELGLIGADAHRAAAARRVAETQQPAPAPNGGIRPEVRP